MLLRGRGGLPARRLPAGWGRGPAGRRRAAGGGSGEPRRRRSLTVVDCGVQWCAVGGRSGKLLATTVGDGGGERRCSSALTPPAWTTRGGCSSQRSTARSLRRG